MISVLKHFWAWSRSLFKKGQAKPHRTVYVEELPDKPATNTVYVLGQNSDRWFVAMICPCGCGEILQMSLLADARPRWRLIEHRESKTISLEPSVWRKVGCRSHFFLKRGLIHWCG